MSIKRTLFYTRHRPQAPSLAPSVPAAISTDFYLNILSCIPLVHTPPHKLVQEIPTAARDITLDNLKITFGFNRLIIIARDADTPRRPNVTQNGFRVGAKLGWAVQVTITIIADFYSGPLAIRDVTLDQGGFLAHCGSGKPVFDRCKSKH